jgi:hypothetical protein
VKLEHDRKQNRARGHSSEAQDGIATFVFDFRAAPHAVRRRYRAALAGEIEQRERQQFDRLKGQYR